MRQSYQTMMMDSKPLELGSGVGRLRRVELPRSN